jgi:hypothetical protein
MRLADCVNLAGHLEKSGRDPRHAIVGLIVVALKLLWGLDVETASRVEWLPKFESWAHSVIRAKCASHTDVALTLRCEKSSLPILSLGVLTLPAMFLILT